MYRASHSLDKNTKKFIFLDFMAEIHLSAGKDVAKFEPAWIVRGVMCG